MWSWVRAPKDKKGGCAPFKKRHYLKRKMALYQWQGRRRMKKGGNAPFKKGNYLKRKMAFYQRLLDPLPFL